MPPVSKADQSTIHKDVDFVAKDDEEQIATGIVMVPHAVDLQGDWERPETIQGFAEQFAGFEEIGQAGGGVMHATWPDGHMELVENEIISEATEIGGKAVPAGAWRQDWKFNDDELWSLVGDVLEGYSIGAVDARWDGPMEQSELPEEVSVPDEIPGDEPVWELTDGIIREVSVVDVPAVVDAQILETKDVAEKRLADHLGNRDGFVEEALQRGHTEAEAGRLWEYLNRAANAEGAGTPGKQSMFARAGKAFFEAFTRADEPSRDARISETPDTDPRKSQDSESDKEGRTLSKRNRDNLFASIDAAADVLEDAGVDHDIERFTDRDDVDFDLSEHQAREWPDSDEDEDVLPISNAAGGDTPDDGGTDAADDTDTTDMTDDTPDGGDDKSLAEQNAEQINELTSAVENLTETLSGPQPKTAEIEIDGETYEIPEESAKAALGVDEDAGVGVADAIESLQQKADRVDDVEQRLNTISQQSGVSTQLEASAAGGEEGDDEDGLEGLGKALS